ncbi:TM2 domain-containing protein [Mycoplasma enhydrae]|uniref:TM2 domain-containing protein n=1 Tax=Mycoplasma enhydrae TaxID=2499220 RepID=UPI00197B4CC8|nr:TM2 domain-containing protein [Mycoplasma enhydrae]MBN4089578.1 TM2 domain-containing protein [Mycoplasma enhydrae]MCV3733828.1 TM2 domain-containing protein [Mycoplasma enhydrae]MCV3753572.1 TM2 domain-containing protein [Mycoplasma enhydrae]
MSHKSRLVLTILSFFLGWIGIDRFYGGRIGLGILKIFFGLGIWHLVDFILAACGQQKDDNGNYISNWKTK